MRATLLAVAALLLAAAARVRRSGRTIDVTAADPGARSLTLTFRGGTLPAARRVRRTRSLPFVVDPTDGGGERSRSTLRARAGR